MTMGCIIYIFEVVVGFISMGFVYMLFEKYPTVNEIENEIENENENENETILITTMFNWIFMLYMFYIWLTFSRFMGKFLKQNF